MTSISRGAAIGAKIRERRKALGLSQEELARMIGTVQKQVSRYETGENSPTSDVIIELTYALDASADWLLGLSDNLRRVGMGDTELSEIERETLQVLRGYTSEQQRRLVDFMYLARRFIVGGSAEGTVSPEPPVENA